MSEEGTGLTVGPETKPKRKRRSPDYVLQELLEQKHVEGEPPPPNMWIDAKDGFVSPEQALAHIEKAKLQGTFRVVRQASPAFKASMTTPEPVYSIEKVDLEAVKNG